MAAAGPEERRDAHVLFSSHPPRLGWCHISPASLKGRKPWLCSGKHLDVFVSMPAIAALQTRIQNCRHFPTLSRGGDALATRISTNKTRRGITRRAAAAPGKRQL